MDLGDQNNTVVVLDEVGEELEIRNIRNTERSLRKFFSRYKNPTVAIEAATHSPWISRLLKEMGCTVYVGNPRKLRLIWDSYEKSDKRDARILAMVCRVESRLLWPIKHRGSQAYADSGVIKTRDALVKNRVRLISHINLRKYGISIVARGGKNAKKRAAVAVARKIAVLLHQLWVNGKPYDPSYKSAVTCKA